MNLYQAPKSPLTDEVVHSQGPWLPLHLRRAFLFPPLLTVPVLGLALLVLHDDAPTMHPASLIGLTAASYVAQFTYGSFCYLVLKQFRWLNLPAIAVASQLPFLLGALAFDWQTVSSYAMSAMAVALASAYFVVTPRTLL